MKEEICNTPLSPNTGASFKTHNLKQQSVSALAFVPGVTCKMFIGVFLVLGFGGAAFGFLGFLAMGHPMIILFCAGSIVFGLVGLWMKQVFFAPRKFNLMTRTIEVPVSRLSLQPQMSMISFDEIKALQIVQKWVSSERNRYWAYELNIVKKDGSRHLLIEHADGRSMLADAKKISGFLGCSVVVDADLGPDKNSQHTSA